MPSNFNKNSSYAINSSDVACEIIDDETVILNLKKGIYYSLNKSATTIWKVLTSGISASEIELSLKNEHQKPENFIKLTIELIAELAKEELIVEKSIKIKAMPETITILAKLGQSPNDPILKKYSDLEDLLLLDPIHDVEATGWPEKK